MLNSQGTPTETVRAAFGALQRRDWRDLSRLIEPSGLEELKRRELAFIVAWAAKKDSISAAEREGRPWSLSSDDSAPPEAVARVADVQIPTFSGSPTVAQLAAATATDFFLSWCATVYGPRSTEDPMDEIVGLQR